MKSKGKKSKEACISTHGVPVVLPPALQDGGGMEEGNGHRREGRNGRANESGSQHTIHDRLGEDATYERERTEGGEATASSHLLNPRRPRGAISVPVCFCCGSDESGSQHTIHVLAPRAINEPSKRTGPGHIEPESALFPIGLSLCTLNPDPTWRLRGKECNIYIYIYIYI